MAKIAMIFGIVVNLGMLAGLKYLNFIINNWNRVILRFSPEHTLAETSWLAPIGISFYTMQVIGYILDVYWGITEPENNILKTGLFISYYPQLTSGPIARHEQMKDQLFEAHSFSWHRITFGLQRVLWGIFKKLVLAARLSVIVEAIYANVEVYTGLYIWIAAGLFMLELYCDFSGCMDIIIGASECYGIILPENFRTPFFSKTVQEYWQRWHITLGEWSKDYILYPVLRTKLWCNMTKSIKKHLGKKAGRQIPSYLGMLCVWLWIGLWHGGAWKYVLGEGMWFWACIVLEQVLNSPLQKVNKFLHINTETFGWKLFQSLRTFVLVVIGNMFFKLNDMFAVFHTIKLGFAIWNPWILFDGSLYNLGLDEKNFRCMLIFLGVLLFVSCIQEKESVREVIARQNIVFRWIVYIGLIWIIAVFGIYGPGYDAASFIYGQF